ncbi:ALDOL protein, partial [Pseudoatta argentina]
MCHAGDYGTCIVSAIFKDKTIAVNSCLVLVLTCDSLGKGLSLQQIENSFGGNICRCTRYRAILDAFKGFAIDAHPSMVKDIQDMRFKTFFFCFKNLIFILKLRFQFYFIITGTT